METFTPARRARGAARALFITGLYLGILTLVASLAGSALRLLPYAKFVGSHSVAIWLAIGMAVFLSIYMGWHPVKHLAVAIRGGAGVDRWQLVINVGLAIVVVLVVVALITSLYQTVAVRSGGQPSLWRDPEIIAVAIGLILSVLFVDRWRSLEGKVDGLASDQSGRLKDIQQFTHEHIELKVGQIVDKAEKVSAKLASISEQNPWLEVVTERDIIVETDSVRGILRSAYNLLNESKTLHLFEYLDFCSRKGTRLDPRQEKISLRGTADDFLEIAIFCEIWLGDYALSVEFLRRYVEEADFSSYAMYPDLIRRLLRIGDLPAARYQMHRLERIVRRRQYQKYLPFLDMPQPMSARYYWYACNVLALGHAAFGRDQLADRYFREAQASPYSQRFAGEQALIDAERLIYQQRFQEGLALLDREPAAADAAFSTLVDRIVLFERLGEFGRASELRDRIDRARETVRGDDWSASRQTPKGGDAAWPPYKTSASTKGTTRSEAKTGPAEPEGKEQRSRTPSPDGEEKGRGPT